MSASGVDQRPFGALPDGRGVAEIVLRSPSSLQASILTRGAAIRQVLLPSPGGRAVDVTLGYPTLAGYLADRNYLGVIVGRVANRIRGARFTLDGAPHALDPNDGAHCLHGGGTGFHQALWAITDLNDGPEPSVTLRHASPDGEGGFPGTLACTVTYTLRGTDLVVEISGESDRPTLFNPASHAYWNLAGGGTALGHEVQVHADAYVPVDQDTLPAGPPRPVAGTPFDLRTPRRLADALADTTDPQVRLAGGFDHDWALATGERAEPALAARLADPVSGRALELLTTRPALHLYSGHKLASPLPGHPLQPGDGIALEAQMFSDAPNRPETGSIRLDPGRPHRSTTIFRFHPGARG